MVWSFLIPAAASLLGAKSASKAAKGAAATTAAATDRATELQKEMFERQVELQEPWRQAGVNALTKLQAAADYTPFSMEQFQADPGYGFRLAEGLKAIERGAAARGGLMSGATGKALTRYGQEAGSQEFMNAFNRYQLERQARLNPLQSLANVGQTAAQTAGGAAGQYGANVGNMLIGQGQTAANAMLARGSAYQRGLGDIGYLAGRYYGQPSAYSSPYAAGGSAGAGFGSGAMFGNEDLGEYFSDIRLKTDIVRVGTRPDGLGVYEYNYVWGGPRQTGLMAHEVQSLYPEAVGVREGYLTVDYGKV